MPRWSIPQVADLVNGHAVSYTDVLRNPVPTPDALRGLDTEADMAWWTDLTHVHAPDRSRVIRAFTMAVTTPGRLTEATVRLPVPSGWVRQRIRFLDLRDHPEIGALLTVLDDAEPVDASADGRPIGDPLVTPWVRALLDDAAEVYEVDGMVESVFGRSHAALVGMNALDLIHPDDFAKGVDAGMRAAAEPGRAVSVVHRMLRPDGTAVTVESTLVANGGGDGGWSLHVRDAVHGMRADLRRALDADQFVVHYQPVINLRTGRPCGAEALVRWRHPARGMVPPATFIPAAEESGLIAELGAYVLRTACAEAATWPGHVHVAVNLSVRQLCDDSIVSTVADALHDTGLDPSRLVLEVTETAVMDDAEKALADLGHLKALGVRLAIDDFGTGYSSLIYLKRMPVDAIKIDRSFVDGLVDDDDSHAIVASVVSLAQAFGIETVAEGVETMFQWARLRALDCDTAQGFLWARALPAEQFRAYLADPEAGDPLRRATVTPAEPLATSAALPRPEVRPRPRMRRAAW